jgi:hypothetical protein
MSRLPDPYRFGNVKNAKEVEVLRRDGDEALELRQVWMPYSPPLVFSGVMGVFTLVLLLMFGLPDSEETLAVMGGILVLIGYAVAAQCFNSTVVTVTESELRWRHGPFPWRRGGRLPAGEIASVAYGKVRKTNSPGESERGRRYGHRKRSFYAVGVRLRSEKSAGRLFRLFDGMLNEGTAAMLAETISGHLDNGSASKGSGISGIEVQRAEQEDLAENTVLRVTWVIVVVVVLVVVAAIFQ